MEKYEIIGWIAAKGGSKRLPGKNVKMLLGKPMIAYAIEACVGSKYISRTFVSTDDAKIKEVSLKYGAEVINRPAELCAGNISSQYALMHLKIHLLKENYKPDFIVAPTPTSPMVTIRHVDEAIELYLKSESMYLASVTKTTIVPTDHLYIDDRGLLVHCLNRQERARYNQNYAVVYYGSPLKKDMDIYYGTSLINITDYYTAYMPLECDGMEPYIVSQEDSIDVDTEFSFRLAEIYMKERTKKERRKTIICEDDEGLHPIVYEDDN